MGDAFRNNPESTWKTQDWEEGSSEHDDIITEALADPTRSSELEDPPVLFRTEAGGQALVVNQMRVEKQGENVSLGRQSG